MASNDKLSALETLPAELLDRIVDLAGPPLTDRCHRAYEERMSTFGAISRTSRTLSFIGQSYLYKFISTQELGENVQLLLRTLSSSPQLADLVKVLLVRPAQGTSPCMPLDRLEICWEATERNLGQDVRSDMANATFNPRRSCRTWEIVMLTALTNKIRTLVYYFDSRGNGELEKCRNCPDMAQILMSMLSTPAASTETTKYANLSEVHIIGSNEQGSGPTFNAALAPVMQRPKVTTFIGTAIRSVFERNSWPDPTSASSISQLGLQNCLLNGRDISRLISGCRALVKLSIDWSRRLCHVVEPCALIAALQQHHSSLKTLTLIDSTMATATIFPIDQSGVFAHGLSDFACLTSLTIDEDLLFHGACWTTDDGQIELALTLPASLTFLKMYSLQDLRALPTTIPALCSSIPEDLQSVEVMLRPNKAYDLRMCHSPATRSRPGGPLQWTINETFDIHRSSDGSARGVRLVKFHCWKQTHSIATSMRDIIRLADSGGIDKVLDHLHVSDPENPCRCFICSPYLPYPLVLGMIPIRSTQTS
ncbi:unnamed protein product [Cercospora beticola]|nr:unnamed protein product [Cercospora beticola]